MLNGDKDIFYNLPCNLLCITEICKKRDLLNPKGYDYRTLVIVGQKTMAICGKMHDILRNPIDIDLNNNRKTVLKIYFNTVLIDLM